MYYESERIVRKNLKHENTRAYAVIKGLEVKSLSTKETIEAINILLEDENTEFQAAVLNRANTILKARKEIVDEKEDTTKNDTGDVDNTIACPVLRHQREL